MKTGTPGQLVAVQDTVFSEPLILHIEHTAAAAPPAITKSDVR